jgi:hypothetical protein
MTTLQQQIDHWEAELDRIAETSTSDNWFLAERRLAEAQHTIAAFRGEILPLLAERQPADAVVTAEIEQLVDHLEDVCNDLFWTLHPTVSYQEIANALASLRALSALNLRAEETLQDTG